MAWVCQVPVPAALCRPQNKHRPLELWGIYLSFFTDVCYFQLDVTNSHVCGAPPTSERTRPGSFGSFILNVLLCFVAFRCLEPHFQWSMTFPFKNNDSGRDRMLITSIFWNCDGRSDTFTNRQSFVPTVLSNSVFEHRNSTDVEERIQMQVDVQIQIQIHIYI